MPLPNPEPGLVISYAYLWHHEHEAGREKGRKDRPSVIVLAVEREAADATIVTVLPIAHSPPADKGAAVEIPLPVKRHLGLGDERSWIVVAEGNKFLWPGYDLRKIGRTDRYDYGFLPPRFFNRVLDAFAAGHEAGKRQLTPRDRRIDLENRRTHTAMCTDGSEQFRGTAGPRQVRVLAETALATFTTPAVAAGSLFGKSTGRRPATRLMTGSPRSLSAACCAVG